MDNINWNSFITFSNNDLKDINLLFILSYSKPFNKNLDDINLSLPSGYKKNNSQVNTSLFSSLFKSNNNCSFSDSNFVNSNFVNKNSVNRDSYKNDILVKLDKVVNNLPVLTALKPLTRNKVKKDRFGIVFSTTKTAINIVLETKSNDELIQILKNFILIKQNSCNKNNNSESVENNQGNDGIITLQQDLIEQTNDLHLTKI
ncbi:1769_t:CDS:2 [Cetraspora pellucida]|uniref:1769_t:CDS:1 n=1 Tax=Cetraspora pellucida TaxID=1433469 RepID=A0A9N9GFL2_9GLOM|nr:1769_t:CDS:2 [Cetraspora pellucida]